MWIILYACLQTLNLVDVSFLDHEFAPLSRGLKRRTELKAAINRTFSDWGIYAEDVRRIVTSILALRECLHRFVFIYL